MADKSKWLLCPGPVMSKTDGQIHQVGARQLAQLYGVPMSECVTRPSRWIDRGWRQPFGLTELHPRYDGDYTLPQQGNGQ